MRSKVASVILVMYVTAFYMLYFDTEIGISAMILFLLFPVVLTVWVLIVLLDKGTGYPELGNDEWGYADKNKSDIGIL
jgi:hypothetical protein